jgi:hypothetical protein
MRRVVFRTNEKGLQRMRIGNTEGIVEVDIATMEAVVAS